MVFANGAGNYVFTLFDNFAGSFPLLIIALGEAISISWIYGLKRSVKPCFDFYPPMNSSNFVKFEF